MSNDTTTPTQVTGSTCEVQLDSPLMHGEQRITSIVLRRPRAGELRGVSLTHLLQLDVGALQAVLPRITMPTLTRAEVDQLDPADLVALGTEVAGFLVPKAARAAA
ncbi:phage tail protein [Rubrivivax gelatinosus]|uniref:Phage tail protein n=1 Tax=Rubrivivax gelatinosus TaxID=28068 RepID=A0ABS1DNZ3_RUBGE|nr:phage tail assembly protein [Rubrivivax gelatinosus]MBK1616804.1 phage tail protein [Rubrivivax gelatinosus]MBK1711295.1 phage tail protein [Rubrivivax gelatinosus]